MENQTSNLFSRILYIIVCVSTGMIGYEIHHSIFWAIINAIFWPISWIWWLATHQVNLTLIHHTFSFLAQ